jgi:hypothetical protein
MPGSKSPQRDRSDQIWFLRRFDQFIGKFFSSQDSIFKIFGTMYFDLVVYPIFNTLACPNLFFCKLLSLVVDKHDFFSVWTGEKEDKFIIT